ncbi:unnamed protein product [Brugia pahangi]|uniref:Ig-like domain-containing protein n=1 Tax=Brugia pahangi TaxID=6280 RepID=A0A0N4T3N8_BRUPA|nr:unnamed protein product [Brugia pahangi]
MAPPVIHGEPKIVQDSATNSVFLEVIASGLLPEKTKWFLGEKEIEPTKTYVFSEHDEGGKKTLLRCEIKVRKSSFHGLSKIGYFDISGDAVLVINVNQSVIEAVRNNKLLKLQINMIKLRLSVHLEMKFAASSFNFWTLKAAAISIITQALLLLLLQNNVIIIILFFFFFFIKNFDKELAGSYKAKFYSSDGENSATFTVKAGNAPEFHDKPHIVQRDGGNIIVIKVRAKSHLDMTAEWFKDDKPLKATDRIKIVAKKDDKDKEGFQFLLEIHGPVKEDQAKYKCVVKNSEGQNEQSLNLCFD